MTEPKTLFHHGHRITFRIERNVILDPLWFDQQWYDQLRADGLSHEDALRQQVETGLQEDPTSLLWESFGPGEDIANEFAASITHIDLGWAGGMMPYVPPAWVGNEDEFPWPEWERTCPGCGRYTRHFHIVSGESCRCAYCGWMGDLPETKP